jgi:hypothetical protein
MHHSCGQDILHGMQMGCKTTNFGCFHGNAANKGFCAVQINLQNAVVILVLCLATMQNKLATAVMASSLIKCLAMKALSSVLTMLLTMKAMLHQNKALYL